jgi:preprotein translocase subunit SecE
VGSNPTSPADNFGLFMLSKINIFHLYKEVKQEMAKILWPTRSETIISTIMVFVMVLLAATYFSVVDSSVYAIIKLILNLGEA